MNKITEQQLHKVKETGLDRLNPDGLSALLLASFIASSFLTLIPFFGDRTHGFQIPWITAIATIFLVLWALHGITMIAFLSMERAYRYQKWQAMLASIISLKLTFEGFVGYFVSVKGEHPYLIALGFFMLAFSIGFLLWSVRQAKINIEKGEGMAEGKGILYSGHSKWWAWLPVLVYVLLLAVLTWFFYNGIGNGWFLAIVMPMTLGMCYAYPEFYFLAYGKWNFPSFIDKNPPDKKKKPVPHVKKGR